MLKLNGPLFLPNLHIHFESIIIYYTLHHYYSFLTPFLEASTPLYAR